MYVYVEGKPALYFRPFQQNEYVDLYYAKLLDPQNPGSAERYRWVNIEQKGALTLQLLQGGKVVKTIHEMPYMVAQIPGAALGYNVVDYNPEDPNMRGRSPSLIAYKLTLDMSGGGYTLRLVDPKTKEVLPGSERELRPVKIRESKSVYLLPSLIPLIAGLGVFIWRRTK